MDACFPSLLVINFVVLNSPNLDGKAGTIGTIPSQCEVWKTQDMYTYLREQRCKQKIINAMIPKKKKKKKNTKDGTPNK